MMPTVRMPGASAALAMRNTSWFAKLLRASKTALSTLAECYQQARDLQNDGARVGDVALDQCADNSLIGLSLVLRWVYLELAIERG